MANKFGQDMENADLKFIREIMSQPLLEETQEKTLAQSWKSDNNLNAHKQLIWAYGRIVVSIASKFRRFGLPYGDLLQEGLLGLLVASERYEVDRGVRFSSYAKWWVRALIQDYVLRNWSIVRTGTTNQHKLLFFNLRRLKRELNRVNNDLLSIEDKTEIAKKLNVAISDIELIEQRLFFNDFSLNSSLSESSDEIWQDLLEDEGDSPEQQTITQNSISQFTEWVKTAMNCLKSREQEVMIRRYLQASPETLNEIGQDLGVTKERIRQIEARAIRKMRHHLVSNSSDIRGLLEVTE